MQNFRTRLNVLVSRKLQISKKILWSLALGLVCLFIFFRFMPSQEDESGQKNPAQPVRVAPVVKATVPVYVQGLGTVIPLNTVLVKSRVDGELLRVHFTEGQDVRAGDLLAEIDPKFYEAKLLQAKGALARDTALLENAKRDLVRYQKLVKEGSVPVQQLQNQEYLVAQYSGTLQLNAANVAEAELQLSYCKITAPIDGRIGFKQVDVGNMVRSSDSQGLVIITKLDPIQVVFSVVGKHIPKIMAALGEGRDLAVEIFDQGGKSLLARGILDSIDNQIDTSTGTVKIKALFGNEDHSLYPNQFVNARLLVENLENVLVVPSSAILQGNDGFYVYVAEELSPEEKSASATKKNGSKKAAQKQNPASEKASKSASDQGGKLSPEATQENKKAASPEMAEGKKDAPPMVQTMKARAQVVKVGHRTDDTSVILEGLSVDQLVVIDGTDRLKDGSFIRF